MTQRKTQTAQVKQKLFNAVKALILNEGLNLLSIQKVADTAGISKGGLFHHFANRDELLLAFFDDILQQFSHRIQQHQHGTDEYDLVLAYVLASFDDLVENQEIAMILLQFISYPPYQKHWQTWFKNQFAQPIQNPHLQMILYTVDGIWLNVAIGHLAIHELEKLKALILQKIQQNQG